MKVSTGQNHVCVTETELCIVNVTQRTVLCQPDRQISPRQSSVIKCHHDRSSLIQAKFCHVSATQTEVLSLCQHSVTCRHQWEKCLSGDVKLYWWLFGTGIGASICGLTAEILYM